MRWNVIKTIARKEFTEAFRNRALHALSAILGVLLISSCIVGWRHYRHVSQERSRLQNIVRDQWVNQPDRHPHRVGHYGSFAFRPKSSLGFFDFGVDSYTGNSIYLEAHKQNTANFSEARHSTVMLRFGELTMALVLQVLAPLLIFFLCFSSCTAERERGTLAVLFCQSVKPQEIIIGKMCGGGLVVGIVLGPLLIASSLLLLGQSGLSLSGDGVLRIGLLTSFYLIYFAIWVALAVLVSARNPHSRGALMTLLSIWVLLFVLIPRALPNIARRLYPAPSKPEFNRALHLDVAKGGNGHDPNDQRFNALRRELLAAYKVDDVSKLPLNWKGVAMREGEAHSAKVYKEHFNALQDIYKAQNGISDWAAFLNPYLAVRNLSMALSGTDYYHFTDFQRKSEAFRFDFVDKLNDFHINKIRFENDRAQKVNRALWKEFPPFVYQQPPVAWALGNHVLAPIALFFWAACIFGATFRIRLEAR